MPKNLPNPAKPGNKEKPKFDKKKWRTEKYSNKVRGRLIREVKVVNEA